MDNNALKLELIEWLTKLEDEETIGYLKVVKDSKLQGSDWWLTISDDERSGIERGLNDIDSGRVIPHDEVAKKHGF